MVFSAVRGGMRPEEVSMIELYTQQGHSIERHPPKDRQAQSMWELDVGNTSSDREARQLAKLFEETRIVEESEEADSE